MKLLLLLLLAVNLYGQQLDTLSYYHSPLEYELLSLLKEYKKDCYADSLLERVHRPPVKYRMNTSIIYEPCLVDWECLTESHYKNEWTHKQPTFEDFIIWLGKRGK